MDAWITRACRASLALALGFWFWKPDIPDAALRVVWSQARSSKIFQHDSFEPGLVVVSFSIFLTAFYLADTVLSRTRALGPLLRGWRVERGNEDMRPWAYEGLARLKHETAWYIVPLALFDVLYPRRTLPAHAPSSLQLVAEVVGALCVYDALFFCAHWACHRVPWVYARVHAKHHRYRVVRAHETIVLSAMELALDVGCSIAALNLVRAHPLSRAAYNVAIVYLLTELHSGYAFPWCLETLTCSVWAGPRAHALHHARGTRNFAKFVSLLDRAARTWEAGVARGCGPSSRGWTVADHVGAGDGTLPSLAAAAAS